MIRRLSRVWLLAILAVVVVACGGPGAPVVATKSTQPAALASDPGPAPQGALAAVAVPAWNHEDAAVPVSPDDPMWGDPLAPVTVVLIADLQCPYSVRAMDVIEKLREDYGRQQVRVVFKHNPLPFHQGAKPAAIAASIVYRLAGPEAFWRFIDRAFANQKQLDAASFERWARESGVDVIAFRQAMTDPDRAAKVEADMALAERLGARGTPTTYVNGQIIHGAQDEATFRQVIDDQIVHARVLVAGGVPAGRVYVDATRDSFAMPEPPKDTPREEPEQDLTEWKVPVDRSPARGARNALVTIVIFSDFQCPFCKRVNGTLEELLQRYPDDLRIVWKDRPLPFHKRAKPAAVFARAARAQRGDAGFWAAHDKLFENQTQLEDADLEQYAQALKLNVFLVRRALAGTTYDAGIAQDEELATGLKASGTPHFFINGRRLVGAQPIEKFVTVIDEQLAKARALVKAGTPRAVVYTRLQRDAEVPPPPPPPERKTVPAPTAAQPWRGGRFAKVVIQQFSDFQCPFCGRVEPTLAQIEQKYGNRVKIVWRHMPLPFHTNAQLAAEASAEVFKQKGNTAFWAFKDKLFENQRTPGGLERPALESYAAELGLDMAAFRSALDQRTHRAAVEADADVAANAGINGTPSFVINGYFVSGAQPASEFERVIDLALRGR